MCPVFLHARNLRRRRLTIDDGNVQIAGSSFSASWAPPFGIPAGSTLAMSDCSICGSTASDNPGTYDLNGGGIYNDSNCTLTLTNCTVAENVALDGGGIYDNSGTVTLYDCTVADNQGADTGNAGGGIYNSGGSVTLQNTIVADNEDIAGGNLAGHLWHGNRKLLHRLRHHRERFSLSGVGNNLLHREDPLRHTPDTLPAVRSCRTAAAW